MTLLYCAKMLMNKLINNQEKVWENAEKIVLVSNKKLMHLWDRKRKYYVSVIWTAAKKKQSACQTGACWVAASTQQVGSRG